jgi:gas vesicle protein
MTRDDVLARIGLQTRTTMGDLLLPSLGIFGAGLAAGAAMGLLLAPKPGAELRGGIRDVAGRVRDKVRWRRGMPALDEMTRDQLYDRARELDIQGRSDMSKESLLEAVRGVS